MCLSPSALLERNAFSWGEERASFGFSNVEFARRKSHAGLSSHVCGIPKKTKPSESQLQLWLLPFLGWMFEVDEMTSPLLQWRSVASDWLVAAAGILGQDVLNRVELLV